MCPFPTMRHRSARQLRLHACMSGTRHLVGWSNLSTSVNRFPSLCVCSNGEAVSEPLADSCPCPHSQRLAWPLCPLHRHPSQHKPRGCHKACGPTGLEGRAPGGTVGRDSRPENVRDARCLFARLGRGEQRGSFGALTLPGPPLGHHGLSPRSRHRQAATLPDSTSWRQPAWCGWVSGCSWLPEVAAESRAPGGLGLWQGPQ